jgi:acyl-CoA-binding protein
MYSPEEIESKFEESQSRWPAFAHLATEEDKKQLYGLYKFILEGSPQSNKSPQPECTDLVKIWKWEAWSEVQCKTSNEAKMLYYDLVFSIGARGGLVELNSTESSSAATSNTGNDNGDGVLTATAGTSTTTHATTPSLPERFSNAEQYVKREGTKLGLGNTDLLELYSYFKQVQKGPCGVPEPSFFSGMEKKAKWTAWKQLADMTKQQAMEAYVNKVTSVAGAAWENNDGSSESKAVTSSNGGSSGRGRPQGLGLNVSTMAAGQQANDGTTFGDWKSLGGLHAAAKNGSLDDVRQLLSSGMDINMQNEEGMTALHWACENGHAEIVSLLLDNNAKMDIQERNDNMTALHFAIPFTEVAELLIVAGADVDAKDNDGVSCIDMCDDADQGPNRMLRATLNTLVANRS